MTPVDELRPHPRNYNGHPPDQIEHLKESIREHGFYRNIVAAHDGTILAGHGVLTAAVELGMAEVPVVRLPIGPDDPRALKVLAGDNEISRMAERDDRALSELLREIKDTDPAGLLGTGYDEDALTNLVFAVRPAVEGQAPDDPREHWQDMPEFEQGDEKPDSSIIVQFRCHDDRAKFLGLLGEKPDRQKSIWYPHADYEAQD